MKRSTLQLVCDALMEHVIGRPVTVSFAHLGQGTDYTVAIQMSLFEFDPDSEEGTMGPMYLTLNNYLLQDDSELLRVLDEVIQKHRGDAE